MRSRGAALPMVLALVSTILVIGLAMGSLSTLSLQMSTRQTESMKMEMAARGAVASVLAQIRKHDGESKLNPLKPAPLELSKVFPTGGVEFKDGPYTGKVTFDTGRAGYSMDNLSGSAAAMGWADGDEVKRVAPYSLDVVVNIENARGDVLSRYRVGLTREWPFALYSKGGPVAMMSVPGAGPGGAAAPSVVKGDVFTQWAGEGGGSTTNLRGLGYGQGAAGTGLMNDPSLVLANLEARQGYHPSEPPNYHFLVGVILGLNPTVNPTDVHSSSSAEEKFYYYGLNRLARKFDDTEDSRVFSPATILDQSTDRDNVLDGNSYFTHVNESQLQGNHGLPPLTLGGDEQNSWTGDTILIRGLNQDPLEEITPGFGAPANTFDGHQLEPLILPRPLSELESKYALTSTDLEYDDGDGTKPVPYLLTEKLVLAPGENSTGGDSGKTHYVINGSVSNRQVVYNKGPSGRGSGVYVREMKSGMRLQDVVLYVKGDLDLSETTLPGVTPDPDDPQMEISGSGATLIVEGTLVLGNAHINAKDQGFVIYANNIVFKGGGTFHGLMIAETSISILSQKNDLEIRGALMCAGRGGITLAGTRIEHDPDFLKSVNGGGSFRIASWQKL